MSGNESVRCNWIMFGQPDFAVIPNEVVCMCKNCLEEFKATEMTVEVYIRDCPKEKKEFDSKIPADIDASKIAVVLLERIKWGQPELYKGLSDLRDMIDYICSSGPISSDAVKCYKERNKER